MKHLLTPLPYKINALEPYISAETLKYHHSVHHDCYIRKLNEIVSNTRYTDMPLEALIAGAPPGPIGNNAVQAWNHSFYWQCMSPDGGGSPDDPVLGNALNQWFGSLDGFRQAFETAGLGLIGSGWVWLVLEPDGRLAVTVLKNSGRNPLSYGQQPLLACDLWEHAYYLDYRSQRTRYLSAFWNLVNWEFVSANLAHPAHLRQTRAYRYPGLELPYRQPSPPGAVAAPKVA